MAGNSYASAVVTTSDSDRVALVGRLLNLSDAAQLIGDEERADRHLLAAWAAYEDPASLCGRTDLDIAQDNAA